MATTSETPVLDTLAAMTVDSVERCGLAPGMSMLTRIAALAASDAPPISCVAHIDPALQAGLTVGQVQDVLVAIAPIVGTARVMTAGGNIAKALGIAIAVADTETEAKGQGKGRVQRRRPRSGATSRARHR
ncbi:carboxymuconolactone decarboxylase [Streptomyces sp. NPDC006265]|uniref:carboxymuconolactone decarboxylase n=1 Tax=Streptomyces sp. NPDC006265 TaxID=3156740 RepID=UPI0033B470BB